MPGTHRHLTGAIAGFVVYTLAVPDTVGSSITGILKRYVIICNTALARFPVVG